MVGVSFKQAKMLPYLDPAWSRKKSTNTWILVWVGVISHNPVLHRPWSHSLWYTDSTSYLYFFHRASGSTLLTLVVFFVKFCFSLQLTALCQVYLRVCVFSQNSLHWSIANTVATKSVVILVPVLAWYFLSRTLGSFRNPYPRPFFFYFCFIYCMYSPVCLVHFFTLLDVIYEYARRAWCSNSQPKPSTVNYGNVETLWPPTSGRRQPA